MTKRMQRLILAVAALGALALGGSAFASAQTGSQPDKPALRSTETPGSQSAADKPDKETVGEKETLGEKEIAGENRSAEQPGAAEKPGVESESAAKSDGPGGHADVPGNATAEHQFQGAE